MEHADSPRLVVVGASAGGIEALSTLVATVPADFGAPIVVAQHLDPRRRSHLGEILGRRSALPVVTVQDHEPLRPATVFVVPSNFHVMVSDHEVSVNEGNGAGPRPSIDLLLSTAAATFGESLIAVILTGTGSDGAEGARQVSIHGGTVIIQDPATASYPSMPASLAPTVVDAIASLDAIGPLLNDLVTGVYTAGAPREERQLHGFLQDLQEQTGIDFTTYKRPTIRRRLERRMAATRSANLLEYARFVRGHPDERQRLISAFLVKVTEFFRDPEMFDYIREDLLPKIAEESRKAGREVRIWSAGCATGEEAYSLGILVAEVLGATQSELKVRIFATDLDGEAIGFARRGIYPASALEGVPKVLQDRYFSRSGSDFEISKEIRALTVFGQHDLGQRAPFPRTDLILCRNVLIYFTPELQRRALQSFAFSLRDGGYLVLGRAESVSPYREHYVVEEAQHKVYRRRGARVMIPMSRTPEGDGMIVPQVARRPAAIASREAPVRAVPALGGRDAVLQQLSVGVVLVNADFDIQQINDTARLLLGIHGPAVDKDLVHQAQGVPAVPLREALETALRGEATSITVVVTGDTVVEEGRSLDIHCAPFPDRESIAHALMTIVDVTETAQLRASMAELRELQARDTKRLTDQQARLAKTNDELLRANQELMSANSDLRSSNEEFVLANEEAQAASEEVETLNEELQATNEELETLNEELQATIEELNTANEDLAAQQHEDVVSIDRKRRQKRITQEAGPDAGR